MDQLTPSQLVVVALLVSFELSHAEIAEDLGITKQAVAKRLNQARGRVTRNLPHLAYEGRRYQRKKSEHPERGEKFIQAVIDIEKRGEIVTLQSIGLELEQNRNMVYRTFKELQGHNLVRYGQRVGKIIPVEVV